MKEWYLINDNTSPNMIGGFENQGFIDCKEDAFLESLSTDIADDFILCNHDLSENQQIRGIIQGNTADTQLKSMERAVLVPIGTLHSGDYIFFEDEYWIVDGRPGNNKIYEKATLKECQYKLRWQKKDGTIIERWANLTSASKYDVGEGGNSVILLSSNNYTILIPHDEDGQTIEGQRVFIDTANNPKKVFKITRNDDPLFFHGSHGGILSLLADKKEFNPNSDRPDLRLCDYIEEPTTPTPPQPSEPDKTTDLRAIISGRNDLKIGTSRIYTISFTNEDGEPINWNDVEFSWNIETVFDVVQSINGNQIELFVDDESLVDSSFLLQCIVHDYVIVQVKITITSGY